MNALGESLARGAYGVPNAVAVVIVCVASAAVGAAVAVDPRIAVLPVGVLASALLLVDGRARVVFVVFGGLLIFQADEGLTLSKLGFLGLAAVAFAGALLNFLNPHLSATVALVRPLLVASAVFTALAAVSLVVAHQGGTPLASAWLRDVSPYLLFVSAPVFAVDAAASFSRRRLVSLLVAAGVFGAVAFAVSWLQRRGIADLPVGRVGLATIFLPAALFAYAMSYVLQDMRARWLVVSALIFALLLVTGTRTNLALLAAPVAIALASRRDLAVRSVRLAVLVPALGAITIGLLLLVVNLTNANVDKLLQRLNVLASTGTSYDYSYIERLRQVEAAWAVFESNILTGSGPGTTFEWQAPNGVIRAAFVLDTSLTFPAKFGLVGLLALVIAMFAYWRFARSFAGEHAPALGYLTLVGYLGVVLVASLGYSPFEDKGFVLGLILVLAIAIADASADANAQYLRVRRTGADGVPSTLPVASSVISTRVRAGPR